jgi:hypothetical protein
VLQPNKNSLFNPKIAIEVPQSTDDTILHEFLPQGIHQFTSRAADRATTDQYVTKVAHVYRHYPPNELLLLIIDIRNGGTPNVPYTFSRAQTEFAGLIVPPARVAYFLPERQFVSVARGFSELLRFSDTHRQFYFPEDPLERAIQWLLSERDNWKPTKSL